MDLNTGMHTYWINGIVKVNGSDLAVINEVDGPVILNHKMNQTKHSGSRPYDVEIHETSGIVTLKLTKAGFKMQQLRVLCGYEQGVGTMDDGITPCATMTIDNQTSYGKRPVIQLLIQGKKSETGKDVEIYAGRAKLISDFNWNLDRDEMAKAELEFECLGDPNDRSANIVQVRDEDSGS